MEKEHHVPGWDGQAKGWRRYTREVCWYVRATPQNKRRHCASKLMSRLTGPARLLAMSWPDVDFDKVGGTKEYLRRLAVSPLVRQSLPNAAAICQQYFSFKRAPGEPIHAFLVREALGYSEFVEAIIRLYEDKHGIKQDDKDFGLPSDELEDEWTQGEWDDWWRTSSSPPSEVPEVPAEDPPQAPPAAATAAPQVAAAEPATPPGDMGSPTGRTPSRQSGRVPPLVPEKRSVGIPSTSPDVVNELTLADSFVLGVLRGFRVLQAAGLSPEDKRDILGTTRGSLEFEVVTHALQTLWDEQFLGRQHGRGQQHDNYQAEHYDEWWLDGMAAYGDDWEWNGDDWDWWDYDGYYASLPEEAAAEEETSPSPEDEAALKEAQQAERVAESLAAEAQRTWSEAQRATQALRKDRGFGQIPVQGKPAGRGPCFICHGPHLSSECPDRRHPYYSKGFNKGKFKPHYMTEYEEVDNYFTGKGKGKKGSKGLKWLEAQAWVKGKKGKGKGQSRPAVNAYSAGMYGLELMDVKEMNTAASSTSLSPSQGLIDCGATASAGPLLAVQSLISSVLERDHQAVIDIQKSERPYFRFGNGQWGRALFRASITSHASGSPKTFKLFALPNPPQLHDPNFDRSSMVPILVGMDYLGDAHFGLCIDFPTGMAIQTNDGEAFQLPVNQKGHYVLDVVQLLTEGHECHEGHATIRVKGAEAVHSLQSLEFHPVEYYDLTVSERMLDEKVKIEAVQRLRTLRSLAQPSNASASGSALMISKSNSANSSSSKCARHVDLQGDDHCGAVQAVDQHGEAKHTEEGTSSAFRSFQRGQYGPEGSKGQGQSMAVLCGAHTDGSAIQPARSMDRMCSVRPTSVLCAESGCSRSDDQVRESGDGGKDASRDLCDDRGSTPNLGAMPCHAGQDRCGRGCECPGHKDQRSSKAFQRAVPRRLQDEAEDTSWEPNSILGGNQRSADSCRNGSSSVRRGEEQAEAGDSRAQGPSSVIDGCSMSKRQQRGERDELRLPSTRPLTSRVASKLMNMAASMLMVMAASTIQLCLDGRDGVWEVACSPHSWLSEACNSQGLQSRRINLHSGFDLYQPATWERLKQLRAQRKPKKIWLSLPCTKFCQWTYINYASPERQELLKQYQRRERKMLWCMNSFVRDALLQDPDCQIYYEWVFPCRGWQEAPMLDLEKYINSIGLPWLDCRVDGCRYGLMDSKNEGFIRKRWLIKTTDEQFHLNYKTKTCLGSHNHVWIQGPETARSAYYPWRFCQSVARFWKQQFLSDKHLKLLYAKEDYADPLCQSLDVEDPEQVLLPVLAALPAQQEDLPDDESPEGLPHERSAQPPADPASDEPSSDELKKWQAKIAAYHKAAGHPTNRNLARLVKNAGQPQWKIDEVMNYKCPACESIKPGGTSSGSIPPASTAPMFKAWQAVGMDTSEWKIPGSRLKLKFLLIMDLATKLRVLCHIKTYENFKQEGETHQDIIRCFSEGWLGHYPKPNLVVMDSANTFSTPEFSQFLSELNIQQHFIPEKEPWANGAVEAAIQDVKTTATAIHLEDTGQDPKVTLALTASSLNATEFTAGFSSFQWAFGSQYSLADEDYRTFSQLDTTMDFQRLVQARQKAEEVAVRTRARRVLSKLSNTTVRQPLRTFEPMDLVKVWRRYQPADQHLGKRGGLKKSGRPHWIGPGRIIFQEVLPHQSPDDARRHICWVLIGKRVMRCSVHSIRPCTPTERMEYDLTSGEDPSKWKTLADIIPKREFEDLADDEPGPDEVECPDLPLRPDQTTLVPVTRAWRKSTYGPMDWRRIPRSSPLGVGDGLRDTRAFSYVPAPQQSKAAASSPVLPPADAEQSAPASPGYDPGTPIGATANTDDEAVNDYGPMLDDGPSDPPDSKKSRGSYDLKWVEQLAAEADMESKALDFMAALQQNDECLVFNIDLDFQSHRQQKVFERNPVAYLVRKLNSSEVNLQRLGPADLELFRRAKQKEVHSFIQNQAVRRCLNSSEVKEAYSTGRILKARWVLTWKAVAPDEKTAAEEDRDKNPDSVVNATATKKAKARIVLLGYQHPSLLDKGFKTSAPVQSSLGRNMLYLLAATHQWRLHGLDLATAFLQTMPTEADSKIWTTGVQELHDALQIPRDSVLRILRNIYGSTTAPRGLWLDLHRTLTSLDGRAALGERCLWLWFSKHEKDITGKFPRLIGAMGGHVDDFHRIGDDTSLEWQQICQKIDASYKWGTMKRDSYRHAGSDINTIETKNGFKLRIDQDAYVESLPDVNIDPVRLRSNGPLTPSEVAACRTSLGGLQWLAIQSQPQLCSRCNILLTEIVTAGTLEHAREIQQMIGEVRREPQHLEFFKLPTVERWNQMVFITMGDQAHNNRPKGDSTGGLVTLAAGPEAVSGCVCPMMLLTWRSWKLKRKAIASNDAEVQAVLEGEDQNYRVRLLWTEMHGACFGRHGQRDDLVEATENQVRCIKGIICTDSRGGYDAVEVNESPLLGLSNLRAALQAFQLRDNLQRVGSELRWLASDYDLADSMTKKRNDSRDGLMKFLRHWHWSIAFDPSFTAAKKNKRAGLTAVKKVDDALHGLFARALQNDDTVNAALIEQLLISTESVSESDSFETWQDVIYEQSKYCSTFFCAGATCPAPDLPGTFLCQSALPI